MLLSRTRRSYPLSFLVFFIFSSCSVQKQIAKSAQQLINNPSVQNAHIGISIYEPAVNKYWYGYQPDKYFTPASNTKIPTCYVAMKYLGDSIVSIRYAENDTAVFVVPSGDPTLLHPDFKHQPAIQFLKKTKKKIYISDNNWQDNAWGSGWSWDDYNGDYMAERGALPVYGNVIKWIQSKDTSDKAVLTDRQIISVFSEPEINWPVSFNAETNDTFFHVERKITENSFTINEGKENFQEKEVPFITNGIQSALELLKDTIGKDMVLNNKFKSIKPLRTIYSQPLDSMLKPMMHRSDNFFAEQSLLMAGNKLFGFMNDEKIIDTLLKSDFKNLPQKPGWADGSGLSRYNSFTPLDFVYILNKMKNEFGMNRIKVIFPTGGTGTIANYYKADSGYIFAKTGTLSDVVSLSGFLYTKKNKLLIFSVLVNSHQSAPNLIRKSVEKFLQGIRNKY
jgi:D-alanyl-D-alanine carboxypeptidase/D-alanyl-D-alanine-endopeptidase (penicillin-binding protein 4)